MRIVLNDIRYLITATTAGVTVTEHARVHIRDRIIEAIGFAVPDRSMGNGQYDVIDCRGMYVIPGLINAHHHLYQSFLRGVGAYGGLSDWFAARAPYLRHFGPSERFHATQLAHLELMENGTTTVCEFASNNADATAIDATIAALADSPLGIVLGYAPPADNLGDVRRVRDAWCGGTALRRLALIPTAVAPSLTDSAAMERFASGRDLADALGLQLTTHLLEDAADRSGSPVAALQRLGCLNSRLLLAHATHLSPTEIDLLARSEVGVAHNPVSNMRLGCGIMPLPQMRAAGTVIGLGTDGGANDSSDLFETMKVAMGLQRAVYRDATVCGPAEILQLATLGGAQALGIAAETGSIEVGKRADLVVIDPSSPRFAVTNDPLAQVVLNASPAECRHVIAGGAFVKRDGRLCTVDREAVIAAAQANFAAFRARVVADGAER